MVKTRPNWSGYELGSTKLGTVQTSEVGLCCAVRFVTTSAVLALLVVSDLGAQRTVVPSQAPLALTNASVVDVRNGTVTRGATVLMRGGRIESIGPPSAGSLPADVRSIDLRGRYVVPGLIDAHVHIGIAQMRAALESGVTMVRSAGVSHYVDVGL